MSLNFFIVFRKYFSFKIKSLLQLEIPAFLSILFSKIMDKRKKMVIAFQKKKFCGKKLINKKLIHSQQRTDGKLRFRLLDFSKRLKV